MDPDARTFAEEVAPIQSKMTGHVRKTNLSKLSNVTSVRGKAAIDRLYRGQRGTGQGLLFLDFDDVLTLSRPYGGYDVFQAVEDQPADLYEKLWHPPAARTLHAIIDEFSPRVVVTTSWLRLMDRSGFETLFRRTGMSRVADALHAAWDAPSRPNMTRHDAIQRWLYTHYLGEPLVVLDDDLSGTGLRGSKLDLAGCVVLCQTGVGLLEEHLPLVRKALGP